MQTLVEQVSSVRGGHLLPLAKYLRPSAAPDAPIDPFTLPLPGMPFREALWSDAGIRTVATVLMSGADVNARDRLTGGTALHIAVSKVPSLPESDSEVEEEEEEQRQPQPQQPPQDDGERGFHRSMERKCRPVLLPPCPNRCVLELLLKSGADVNCPNIAGETPLMLAAAAQNTGTMAILLSHGANTALRDTVGRTVLGHAAPFPHVLQAMQEWIPDLKARAVEEGLLHSVCLRRGSAFAALFMVEVLGVDVNGRESGGDGNAIVQEQQQEQERKQRRGSVDYLNKSANVSVEGATVMSTVSRVSETVSLQVRMNRTPLHCAVQSGDVFLVQSLLKSGADVSLTDATGQTPVELAKSLANEAQRVSRRNEMRCTLAMGPQGVNHFFFTYLNSQPDVRNDLLVYPYFYRTFNDVFFPVSNLILFLTGMCVPHLILIAVMWCTKERWLYTIASLVILYVCTSMMLRAGRRSCDRPFLSRGLYTGYFVALCFYSVRSMDTLTRLGFASVFVACLVPSLIFGGVVVLKNPGLYLSQKSQREVVYTAIRDAHGRMDPSTCRHIDVRSMMRLPLRTQYCRQIGCHVLRYDHYCPWLGTPIGVGNHSYFIGFLIWTLLVFIGLYQGIGSEFRSDIQQEVLLQRLVSVYVELFLPITIALMTWQLGKQVWYISRNVTCYDVQHKSHSPWCLSLGSRVYSLFDEGPAANVRQFVFHLRGKEELSFCMPVMNARLQRIAKNYYAAQNSSCSGGHGHTHGGHGHTHNSHGHAHDSHGHAHAGNGFFPSEREPQGEELAVNVGGGSLEMSPQMTSMVAQQLFQLMVMHGNAGISDGPVCRDIRTGLSPEQWKEVEASAMSMFNFFQQTLNGTGAS